MKKANLVLFVLLASNVFVKPANSRDCSNSYTKKVAIVVAIVTVGAFFYFHGYGDGFIAGHQNGRRA